MDDAMLFKRGKWIDHNKSHPNDKKSPPPKKRGVVWVTW